MITIEYDDSKLTDEEIRTLSHAIQQIVSTVTGIEDVFVYANSARIKVRVAPVEIFVRISAHKVPDRAGMLRDIKTGLSQWKAAGGFSHPINLTLMPMDWQFEIGI